MAAVAKRRIFAPRPSRRKRLPPSGRSLAKARPDYFALFLLAVLMVAIMALALWLASVGGGNIQPVDYWMFAP